MFGVFCSYRSIPWTYASNNTPKMLVPVPLVDLYAHFSISGRPEDVQI